MDFVWDIADKLIKGEAKVIPAQEPATPSMEKWASRVEHIAEGLDEISRRLSTVERSVSTVERSTSFSNYYLRLQARSGYDRTWERRAIRNIKAIASYIGMEEKALLRKIYREMESRYGIVLNDFIQDYQRVKKISRCSTLSVISFSFPLREMCEAVIQELCDACKLPMQKTSGSFDLVDEITQMVGDREEDPEFDDDDH